MKRGGLVAAALGSAIALSPPASAQESEREAQDRIARQVGQEAEQRAAFNIVGPVIICANQVADELIPKAPIRCSNERVLTVANAAYAAFQERCRKQIGEAGHFARLAYEDNPKAGTAFLQATAAAVLATYADLAAKAYAAQECRR